MLLILLTIVTVISALLVIYGELYGKSALTIIGGIISFVTILLLIWLIFP